MVLPLDLDLLLFPHPHHPPPPPRKELGIPLRVKPVPVMEKKPWEEGDEEEVEDEEEPNFILQLLKNSVRQMPCVRALKRKMGSKKAHADDDDDNDNDEKISLKELDEGLDKTRRSSASTTGNATKASSKAGTTPKASPAVSVGSARRTRIRQPEDV